MNNIVKIQTRKQHRPGTESGYSTYHISVPILWAEAQIEAGKVHVQVKQGHSGELILIPLTEQQVETFRREERPRKNRKRYGARSYS